MKPKNTETVKGVSALVVAVCCLSVAWAVQVSPAYAASGPNAVVGGVEGQTQIVRDTDPDPKELEKGDTVTPWDTVSTGKQSKLLLRWDNGLATSMGEFSSIMTAPDDSGRGPAANIQVVEGIVRVVGDPKSLDRAAWYSVGTPVVSIQPGTADEPIDFVVELYEPTKTVLTVVSGRVKITSLRGDGWIEKTINACQSVYIEDKKDTVDSFPTSVEDLQRLIAESTITDTLRADLEACAPRVAREPVRPVVPSPPPVYLYPSFPDYSVDYWDVVDLYPYPEIRVIRRHGPYCVIYIPGAGYFYVPIPVVSGWVYDPVFFEVCARYVFVRHAISYDRYYLHDCYSRRRELYNMIYLAQRSGRTELLVPLRRELDYLNTRANWASRRIHRLEGRLTELEAQQRGFGDRLPRDVNLVKTISDSFNSQQNINVVQNFHNRIKTDLNMQNQLAGVVSREMSTLRTRIADERDPLKRLALWNQIARIRTDMAQGKAPIPPGERGVRDLLKKMDTERDPVQKSTIQQQLLGELRKREGALPPDVATQANLASLRQDITNIPNPQTRQLMERRFSDLEQSLQIRKQQEAQSERIEHLTDQLSKETDARKRKDLLGKLTELSKTVPLVTVPAGMQLLQDRRNVERQLAGEKDAARRSRLQQTLEELKQKQEEVNRQQLIEVAKPPQRRLLEQRERDRQTEAVRKQIDEQKKQAEQEIRDRQLRTIQTEQQRQERERQTRQRLLEQQERERQAEIKRSQQEEQQRQVEQQLREQRQRERQADVLRKERGERQKEVEQRLREQQERERQTEIKRSQQEEQQRQVEQRLREQRQRERQIDLERKQQQEKQIQVEQRLREQQDRARQEQEQLRRQQEQQRAEELRRRQQEEQRRQADQVRQQQLQQERMRLQQIQQQQIQERARKPQVQQQIQERARQPQIQQQQIQERIRQNQRRLQQEEEAARRQLR